MDGIYAARGNTSRGIFNALKIPCYNFYMSFSVDVVNLLLYSAQQLGVMLGVGSASILLVAYLVSLRDGVVDSKEEQFGRAVTRVQTIGLWIIILSGLAITAIHISNGALDIVLSPAFLFKWILIAVLFGASLFRQTNPYPHFIWEGITGATWYALFIVHILAPVVAWIDLIVLYTVWTGGFVLCFVAIFYAMHPGAKRIAALQPQAPQPLQKKPPEQKPVVKPVPKLSPIPNQPRIDPKPMASSAQMRPIIPAVAQKPRVAPPLPPVPRAAPQQRLPEHIPAPMPMIEAEASKTLQVLPPIQKAPLKPIVPVPKKPAMEVPRKPALAVPTKPAPQKAADPDENPGLPAIRVMPRTPQDVDKQNRASTVQFS